MAKNWNQLLVPEPYKQAQFHASLTAARNKWLMDALNEVMQHVKPSALAREVAQFVPSQSRQVLQKLGIREERVFALPIVLRERPTLLGYYRLLLGISQKQFYSSRTGLTSFRPMETKGALGSSQMESLDELCYAMAKATMDLLGRVERTFEARDVEDLQLLALGVQFDGAYRNQIGQDAVEDAFAAIRGMVESHIQSETARRITVRNAAGREVTIALASDPDVGIVEHTREGRALEKVAIEIKGGLDGSNAYNRAGEAEKSHIKAKAAGYRDFWTVIDTENADSATVRSGSPTTQSWYELLDIQARRGRSWEEFRDRIYQEVGIPSPGAE